MFYFEVFYHKFNYILYHDIFIFIILIINLIIYCFIILKYIFVVLIWRIEEPSQSRGRNTRILISKQHLIPLRDFFFFLLRRRSQTPSFLSSKPFNHGLRLQEQVRSPLRPPYVPISFSIIDPPYVQRTSGIP